MNYYSNILIFLQRNMMKKIALSLVSVLALSGFAVAGGNVAPVEPVVEAPVPVVDNSAFYVGIGYGYFKQTTDNVKIDANSVLLQVGYQYNEYVALEGRYWIGAGGIDQSPNDNSGDFDSWGLYVKPMYPVTSAFDIYALLGYADSTIDYDSSWKWETDDFSWGLGAQYAVTNNVLLFVDYTNLGSEDSVDIDDRTMDADVDLYTINVGVSYKF